MPTYLDPLRLFLAQRHPDGGALWAYSENNLLASDWLLATPSNVWGKSYAAFPQSVPADNPAFPLAPCQQADGPGQLCEVVGASVTAPGQTAEKLRVGHSWQIFEALYDVMTSATVLLDFTTLTPPTGLFLNAFRNAITYLSQKPESQRPVVRILFSNPLPDVPPLTALPFLHSITEQLDPAQRMEIYVTVLSSSFASWNHAKIVAADGARALVGGHNMWGPHYLGKNPVFDVSMRAAGGAARHAQDYADSLWQYQAWRRKHIANWLIGYDPNQQFNYNAAYLFNESAGKCVVTPGATPPDALYERASARFPAPPSTSATPVLAIGRGGNTRSSYILPTLYSYLVPFTEPSDEAIVHLVGQAVTSVRMSLQSFHLGPLGIVAGWNRDLFRALGQAMQRGVSVDIVLSNPGAVAGGLTAGSAPYDGESPDEVNEVMRQTLMFELDMKEDAAQNLIAQRFRCASFRYGSESSYPQNAPIPNHAKTLMVDSKVFYIGSQNMYVSNLNEFGWVVEDDQAASDYIARYWSPLWSYAGPTVTAAFDSDVVVTQELEAVQFVLALQQNTRLSLVFQDLKAKLDSETDPGERATLEEKLSDLIVNSGFATTLPKVLEALRTPFFSQTPPSTAPTAEALRFVINLMTSTTLMAEFGKVVDAPASSIDDANKQITEFLSANGYSCTALEVLSAFNALRSQVLSYWAGTYTTWLTPDGGASFTLGNETLSRSLAATAEGDRPLPALGPTLVIDGDGTVTFDGRKIDKPSFANNTLSWEASPNGQGNLSAGRIQFGTVTRGTVNDPFSGSECFGVVTWPSGGTAPRAGVVSLYGRGPSRTPDAGDSPDRKFYTILYVLGALSLAGLLTLLGRFAFRARARAQEYERIGREKRQRDLDNFELDDLDTVSSPNRVVEVNLLAAQRLRDGLTYEGQAAKELATYESLMTDGQRQSLSEAAQAIREASEALRNPSASELPNVVTQQKQAFATVQDALGKLVNELGNRISVESRGLVQDSLETSTRIDKEIDTFFEERDEGLPLEPEDMS